MGFKQFPFPRTVIDCQAFQLKLFSVFVSMLYLSPDCLISSAIRRLTKDVLESV